MTFLFMRVTQEYRPARLNSSQRGDQPVRSVAGYPVNREPIRPDDLSIGGKALQLVA
jgi:hypothetical protein